MNKKIKILKDFIRYLVIIFAVVAKFIAIFLVYSTITDFRPPPVQSLEITQNTKKLPLMLESNLSFITWNIGYCGLDKSMDFFYDGGKKVKTSDTLFQKNLSGVFEFLSHYDTVDFILLQEVDSLAQRSFFSNQVKVLSQALPDFYSSYAINYNVRYVPLPLLKPMGEVVSGILSFSKYKPVISEKYSYIVNYPWPKKIFMLDRCFLMQRFPLKNSRELVVINTHNSAFSDADNLRQFEINYLRSYLLYEYAIGNYVIAGGDWNLNPPDYDQITLYSSYNKKKNTPGIPASYLPEDWQWAYDLKTPTNRDVDQSYRFGLTPTTIYDFFVVSPNIQVNKVKVFPMNFEYSDHQPVFLSVTLKDDYTTNNSEQIISENNLPSSVR